MHLISINVVHQERNLFPTFTVAENVMVEHFTDRMFKKVNKREINEAAQTYLDMVGLQVSPQTHVDALSAGQQQLIEIAKALSSNAKIILLDEPTSSVSVSEAEMLLNLIKIARSRDLVHFVSHKIEEVLGLVDTITVLRDGKM